jgi:Helix-turn-helix domain
MSTAVQTSGLLADYASPEQTAAELGVSTRTLARWRAKRTGPPYTLIGRKLQYRRSSMTAWLQRRERDPEHEREVEVSRRRRRA